MEIRAYLYSTPSSWVYWIENTHFNLPGESNQGLNLYWDPSKDSNVMNATTEFKSTKNIKGRYIQQTGTK